MEAPWPWSALQVFVVADKKVYYAAKSACENNKDAPSSETCRAMEHVKAMNVLDILSSIAQDETQNGSLRAQRWDEPFVACKASGSSSFKRSIPADRMFAALGNAPIVTKKEGIARERLATVALEQLPHYVSQATVLPTSVGLFHANPRPSARCEN